MAGGWVGANLADHLLCTRPRRRSGSGLPSSGTVGPGPGRVLLIALFAVGSRRLAVAAVFETLLQSPGRTRQSYPDRTGTVPGPGSTRRCALPPWPRKTWRWSPRRPWSWDHRASFRGSLSPPAMASMMSMPVLPVMSLITCCLYVHLGHAFCICWTVLHQHGPLPQVAAQCPRRDGRLPTAGRRCATAAATGSPARRSCDPARS